MDTAADLTPKSKRQRTLFPGKVGFGLSFNLTALGRSLLKEQAAEAGVSIADYLHLLIKSRVGMPPLQIPGGKMSGPKGGAKSYFFGKNRGTTTAITATPELRRILEEQVGKAKMSRGDYIEFLLREKTGVLGNEALSGETESPMQLERVVIGGEILS